MNEFTITITQHDVAVIGNALRELPYKQVAELITKLDAQLIAQQQKTTQ